MSSLGMVLAVAGLAVGLAGLIGTCLTIRWAGREKRRYEQLCRQNCEVAVGLTASLANSVTDACTSLKNMQGARDSADFGKSFDLWYPVATAHVQAATEATKQLILHCERLNVQHKEDFGRPVYEDLCKVLPAPECIGALREIFR